MPDIDYDALARQHGAVDFDAIAKQHGAVSSTAAPAAEDHGFLQNAWDFTKNAAAQLNPLPMIDHYVTQPIRDIGVKAKAGDMAGAAMQAVRAFDPAEPVANLAVDMVRAQVDQGRKAVHAARQGDYSEAFGHGLAAVVPAVGPAAANVGEQIGSGDIAGGLGAATGLLGSMVLPEGVARSVGKDAQVPVVPKLVNPNPVEAGADAYAAAHGLPRTVGGATGNGFVQGVQHLADKSVLGAVVANKANAADAAAMAAHGDQLADQVHPVAVDPVQAGLAQRSEIEGVIQGHHADANANYNYLRQLEADPANLDTIQKGTKKVDTPASAMLGPDGRPVTPAGTTDVPVNDQVPMAIDMRDAKKVFTAVDADLSRNLPVTQQRMSPALKAIRNILEGPDFQSASVVDRDLGFIKGMARGADLPELKSAGQGLASFAVKHLEDAIEKRLSTAQRTPGVTGTLADTLPADAAVQTAAGANTATAGNAGVADSGSAGQGDAVHATAGPGGQTGAGPQTTLKIPGQAGGGLPAVYRVRELADLQASHDGNTFNPNTKFGLNNDRNYANPANQAKVVNWSSPAEFDPSFHVTDNPDATNGPLVTDEASNVLGGNGRKMILDRVYKSNPQGAAAYRQLLLQKAAQFGIDPAEVAGMRQPVLTREIPDAALGSVGAKQNAITDLNKVGTAALTPAERAIADSRRVSPGTLDSVAGMLEEKGPDASVADLLSDPTRGPAILQRLIDDGVISPQERAGLLDKGVLSRDAKSRVSSLLVGRYFRDPAQLDAIAPALRNKIERMAAPLAKVDGVPEWDLTPHVRDALDLAGDAAAHGLGIDDYLKQSGLYGDQEYSPKAIALAKGLKDQPANQLVAGARQYAGDAAYASEPSMFGDAPAAGKSFADAFGGDPATIDRPVAPRRARARVPAAGVPAAGAGGTVDAGADALQALRNGREATAAKYDAADVLKAIPQEGRAAFNKAFWSKDAGIGALQQVAKSAPNSLPCWAGRFCKKRWKRPCTTGKWGALPNSTATGRMSGRKPRP